MKTYPVCFDHMLAAWNEKNVERIREHLDLALAENVVFIDPTIVTNGIPEFDANIRQFRLKYPDSVCIRTSGFDSHHRLYRYSWEIKTGDTLVVAGFDVAELDDADRVTRVLGFFGPLPGKE